MKTSANILLLDDDDVILASVRMLLKQKFSYVQTINNPKMLFSTLKEVDFQVLLLDMNFTAGENSGQEGLDLIDQVLKTHPDLDIIALTAYGEIDLAVEAVRRGARDFMTKPWRNEKLLLSINHLLDLRTSPNHINKVENENGSSEEVIGESRVFQEMMKIVRKVAPTEATVLIRGENGTGKDLIAQEIHRLSERSDKTLVTVDLGALAPTLLESELFGHKKGAFTDAINDKEGKLKSADNSTLFLDEVGNLPLVQQSKLLTALQKEIITPVGSNSSISINVRFISATNADLDEMAKSGEFRQDLLFRLNTIEIMVPPLRERQEDIPLLISYYLNKFKKSYKKPSLKIDKQTISNLQSYVWPGNVRELAQAIERAVILSDSTTLTLRDFQLKESTQSRESLDLKEMEKGLILKALEKNKGNITHAAKDLGIDRLALYRRLEKYGL